MDKHRCGGVVVEAGNSNEGHESDNNARGSAADRPTDPTLRTEHREEAQVVDTE